MKGVWDDLLTPFGKSLSLSEIAALAALSGISEEIFFRGAVQGEIGIVGASLLFGLLHPLNLSYVIWASTVGFAFGLLFQATGSLIPPIARRLSNIWRPTRNIAPCWKNFGRYARW